VIISAAVSLFHLKLGRIGKWYKSRFAYHAPLLIFKEVIFPEDDGKRLIFKLPKVPTGVTVGLYVQCKGGISSVGLNSTLYMREMDAGILVPDSKNAALLLHCPANSLPTSVSVFIEYIDI